MSPRPINAAAIETEIDRVRSLGLDTLRDEWRTVFGAAPPDGLSKDILARMIAYRAQERAFGGHDRETTKLLARLARGEESTSDLNRRLKHGTVVVREYRGERHAVTVVPGGFAWQGTIYRSLSTIARAITGTAWNGPRFFGLRMADKRPKRVEATTVANATTRDRQHDRRPRGG
jgi:hypothetical protein